MRIALGGLMAWWLGGLILLALSASLPAQDTYKLEEDQWQKQPAVAEQSPEGQLQAIRKALAEGESRRARSMASAWLKNYPSHPHAVEAYLLRGDAQFARRDYYDSLFDYEYVIRQYPGSEQFTQALQREYDIAVLYTGVDGARRVNRKLLGMRILPAKGEGEELFIRIQERAPGSPLGEKASLALADYYFGESDMNNAVIAYGLFLVNYPQSVQREHAMLMLIRANLATFKNPRFDPTGLIEASEHIRQYQAEFPAQAERLGVGAILIRIDESLALKMVYQAQWYEKTGEPASAAYMYRRVVREYPQTAAAQSALKELKIEGTAQPAPESAPSPGPGEQPQRAPGGEPAPPPAESAPPDSPSSTSDAKDAGRAPASEKTPDVNDAVK